MFTTVTSNSLYGKAVALDQKIEKDSSESRNDQRHLKSPIAICEDEADPCADEGYFESYDLRPIFLTLNSFFSQLNKKVPHSSFPIPCRFAHIDESSLDQFGVTE